MSLVFGYKQAMSIFTTAPFDIDFSIVDWVHPPNYDCSSCHYCLLPLAFSHLLFLGLKKVKPLGMVVLSKVYWYLDFYTEPCGLEQEVLLAFEDFNTFAKEQLMDSYLKINFEDVIGYFYAENLDQDP